MITTRTHLGRSLLLVGAMSSFIATHAVAKDKAPVAPAADGANVTLALEQPLSSSMNHKGDTFRMRVVEAVRINGRIVVKAGTVISGVVSAAKPSGRLSRQGRLTLDLGTVSIGGHEVAIHGVHDVADANEGGFEKALHKVASPLSQIASNVIAAADLGDDQPQPMQMSLNGKAPRKLMMQTAMGMADPMDRVEFTGSERARLLQRGLAGLTRVGTGYLNAIVNGPAGLLKRGANIEVPVGSVIHAVILLEVPATNRT